MSRAQPTPTGRESRFDTEEIIVTKTDLKGRLTYANDVFLRVSSMKQEEALGAPHSIIRHPEMPRTIFKMLWDRIQAGQEIFAYVLNLARNGDHYWVFAHVTPSRNADGTVVGYHSSRRKPDPGQIAAIEPIYRQLLAEERRHADRKEGMACGVALLESLLKSKGLTYDELVFSL